jgi:iron complex outermembrane receptor protein
MGMGEKTLGFIRTCASLVLKGTVLTLVLSVGAASFADTSESPGERMDNELTIQLNALRHFDIDAQELPAALLQFGEQAELTVMVHHDAGGSTSGLQGEYSIDEALRQLLAGTGLEYRTRGDAIVVTRLVAELKPDSRTKKAPLLKRLATAFATAIFATSGAASIAADDATADSNDAAIVEIVVTATKRKESLKNVPISITAIGAETMAQTGTQNIRDIAEAVPNLIFPAEFSPAVGNISIRGVANFTGPNNMGWDKEVGVFLDGVYLGQQFVMNADLVDIERVEVLRGPQGTMFGKNTVAGVINIVSKMPGEEFEGSISADVGNFSLSRQHVSLNVPVNDDLAARVSLRNTQRDGYVTNLFNGEDLADIDAVGGRVQLFYTPSASTSVYLAMDFNDTETGLYSVEHQPLPGEPAQPELGIDNVPFTASFNHPNRVWQEGFGTSLSIEHDFANGYRLTSVTGYRDDTASLSNDVDGRAFDAFQEVTRANQEMLSQELRINSPLGERYDYVAGIYYFNQDNLFKRTFFFGDFWLPALEGRQHAGIATDSRSVAAFVHGNFYVNDGLTLFGGLRYTNDEKKHLALEVLCEPNPWCGVTPPEAAPVDVADSEPSWTVGLRYRFNDDLMAYASIARGFKSGVFNDSTTPVASHASGTLLADPEFLLSYEIGVKGAWADRRVNINAALFYMDWEDMQFRLWCETCGTLGRGANILANAGQMTSKGIEIELTARPTNHLTFNLGVGFLDAVYGQLNGVTSSRPVERGGQGTIDGSGNRPAMAPEWTFNASVVHEVPFMGGTWLSRLDYNYMDEHYSPFNGGVESDDGLNPSRGLLNARFGFSSGDDKWGVFLWGKNLTDKLAWDQKVYYNFIVHDLARHYIEPRTYGATLNFRF